MSNARIHTIAHLYLLSFGDGFVLIWTHGSIIACLYAWMLQCKKRCVLMRGLGQRLLHDEAGALNGEECDHDDADDDAVDAERGEVVLLDVSHEEADRDD